MKIKFSLPPKAGKFYRVFLPIAGVLVAVWGFFGTTPDMPQGFEGFRKAPLALEFVRDQSQIDGLTTKNRNDLAEALYSDTRFVIPGYWLYFGLLSAFLYSRQTRIDFLWLAVLPVSISVAGIADILENLASLAALKNQPDMVGLIYPAALVKWAGFAMSCLLLGVGFVFRRKLWPCAAGVVYIVCGLAIASGLIAHSPLFIEGGIGLLGISIFATGQAIHHA